MVSIEGKLRATPQTDLPPAVRIAARILSYIFHPLFIPLFLGLFLIYEIGVFPDRTAWEKKIVLIQFFIYYTFFPLVVTVFAKSLGFVESSHLKTQKDRILPFVVCEIFYFWAWYVFKNLPYPKEMIMFGLGVFLASSLGLILNVYMKVSLHGIAVGVLCAFMLLAAMMTDRSYGIYIAVAFLIAGLTCTARLIDSDHTQREIYFGFFGGAIAQLTASMFV